MEDLKITLEFRYNFIFTHYNFFLRLSFACFSGGAELLFNKIKKRDVILDGKKIKTIQDLLHWMRDNILTERPDLFLQNDSV